MRAVVQSRYGPPEDVLTVHDIDRPKIGDDEVLVRVRATSVHPDVWHVVTGRPWVLRLMGAGVLRPKDPVPGTDLAGFVEDIGRSVTLFAPGEEVFGETHLKMQWRNGGAFAEYASAPQEALMHKPAGVTFEQAASVPSSGAIALSNLQCGRRFRDGQNVLINGAGGGVGMIAIQLAKAKGARVTGVDRREKLGMILELGADEVIDFTREDVTRRLERYDLILDVASNLSLATSRRMLRTGGFWIPIGHDHYGAGAGRVLGSLPRFIALMTIRRFVPHFPEPGGPMPSKNKVMTILAEMLETGTLTPVVDSSYPLDDVHEAMRRLREERSIGKIVLTP